MAKHSVRGKTNRTPGGPPRADLRLQLRLLRLAGAWGPSTPAPSLLYRGYSAAVVLLLVAFVASQVSAMLHFWGDILSVTTNACVTFTYTMAIFKVLVILMMRPSAEDLIQELNRCMQEYGCELSREKSAVFLGCGRLSRRVVAAHVGIGAVAYFCGVAQAAARSRACPTAACRARDGFPVLVWYPFPYTASPEYQVMFAATSLALFYGCILSTTLDGFFVTLIIYLSGQLRLLNLMAESLCSGSASVSEARARARLAQCVRYHTDVDRSVQQLSSLLGPILLGQVLADVITLSATACVTTTSKMDSGWVFMYGSYLAAIAEQLLLYCWYGNDILTESERLQLSAYSSQWVGAPPRFRKELRVFLCRAHRPLTLTASKFYTISRETFLLLMNASFSYYAVLRQLNSD